MKTRAKQRSAGLNAKTALVAIKATKDAIIDGTSMQLAAGVAYYGTLSFFPLVVALVAITSLVFDASQVVTIADGLTTYLPSDIASLLSTQLENASTHQQSNVLVVIVALAFSVLGVSGAMNSIIKAIIAMNLGKDTRSFIQQQLLSVGLTVGLIAAMAFILPLLFVGPNALIAWNVPDIVIAVFSVVRWLILLAIAIVGLGVVYHFALPDNRAWQWFGWGSLIATALWLIITAGFFVYLQYFANFSNSYSFFAGIIALMIWLNFSAFTVLVGAYVNRACEA